MAVEVRFYGLEDHFAHVSHLAGPLAATLAEHPDKLDAVRATATQLASTYVTADGLVFPGPLTSRVCRDPGLVVRSRWRRFL